MFTQLFASVYIAPGTHNGIALLGSLNSSRSCRCQEASVYLSPATLSLSTWWISSPMSLWSFVIVRFLFYQARIMLSSFQFSHRFMMGSIVRDELSVRELTAFCTSFFFVQHECVVVVFCHVVCRLCFFFCHLKGFEMSLNDSTAS